MCMEVPSAPTSIAAPTHIGTTCGFQDMSALLQRSDIEAYVESVVEKKLLEMGDDLRVSSSRALPTKIKEIIKNAVRELKSVDPQGLEEKLGTIVFLKKDLAITCFHEVYKNGRIMEGTLQVDGKALLHIASFPYYDISLYKCPDREGGWLELGSVDSIGLGGQLYLASYPSIANVGAEDPSIVICNGSVACIEDPTVLGQYQCFPGSSGGAILSSSGKLLGIYLESLYHQDGSILQPPDWYYDCTPSEVVRTLEWGMGTDCCVEDFWENADMKKVAMFGAQNVSSKGHLGRFLSVSMIRAKLVEEGMLPSRGRKRRFVA